MNLNLTMDVHAPSKLRANIQLQNLDDFFAGKPLKNEVCIRCAGN